MLAVHQRDVPESAGLTAWPKLLRMLSSACRHRGNHMAVLLAAIAALSYYVSRRTAKAQLQQKILSRLVALAREATVSRVQSAVNLSSMDRAADSPSSVLRRSQSLIALGTILEEGNDNAVDESSSSTRSLSRKPSELALSELATLLGTDRAQLAAHHRWTHRMSWAEEPHALGGYASVLPGSMRNCRQVLAAPMSGVVFWAGEATAYHSNPQTAHGAIESGLRAAKEAEGSMGGR